MSTATTSTSTAKTTSNAKAPTDRATAQVPSPEACTAALAPLVKDVATARDRESFLDALEALAWGSCAEGRGPAAEALLVLAEAEIMPRQVMPDLWDWRNIDSCFPFTGTLMGCVSWFCQLYVNARKYDLLRESLIAQLKDVTDMGGFITEGATPAPIAAEPTTAPAATDPKMTLDDGIPF